MTQANEHGHHWKEAARVADFAEQMDARAEERARQFALLARLLPYEPDQAIRILDIGAGYGAVASFLLDAFPQAEATLLDVSTAMVEEGGKRLTPYAGRYAYVVGDFASGALPSGIEGPFDAIVSSLAIHHLPAEGKQTLYKDIAARLTPGGCFFNIDAVGAPTHDIDAVYARVTERERAAAGESPASSKPAVPSREHHSERQPLADHLAWLRDAGLVEVDCYWKNLGTALFGGYRPSDDA
jgi:tRNA (cmo5U34)-methyltransferase